MTVTERSCPACSGCWELRRWQVQWMGQWFATWQRGLSACLNIWSLDGELDTVPADFSEREWGGAEAFLTR